MKYVPKSLDHTGNAPNYRPLRQFVGLLISLAVICVSLYILLGWAVDWVIPQISREQEHRWAQRLNLAADRRGSPFQRELESILHPLLMHLPESERDVGIRLDPDLDENAYALLGGGIVVTAGLLHKIRSENELTMTLAHELGYFHYRHHLRKMGRSLVVAFLASLLWGQDRSARALVGSSFDQTHEHYSQTEEIQADLYGLDLLVKRYGHAGGSKESFLRWSKEESRWLRRLLGSTHPMSLKRAEILERRIVEAGYSKGQTRPLPARIRRMQRSLKITSVSLWKMLTE